MCCIVCKWSHGTQAQDLLGDSSGDEGSKLQVPHPVLPTPRAVQSSAQDKRSLQWSNTPPTGRRPPTAGPGLSLKQQASSPRWGARHSIGPALVSPGLQTRTAGGAAAPLQRRLGQSRSSAPGLSISSRRAVSQDDCQTDHIGRGGGLHQAQSGSPSQWHPRPEVDKSLIELSDLGSDRITAAGQALIGSPTAELSSAQHADSLLPWHAEQDQAQGAEQPQSTEGQDGYGDWRDAAAPPQDSDNLEQRLLP